MKKTALVYIFLLILVTACSSASELNKNTITVILEGNPTTGYLWNCNSADESVASCIKSEYKPDSNYNKMTGVGGKYYFTIKGISKGQTEILFSYKRPWEKDPIETKITEVSVDSSGNISVI